MQPSNRFALVTTALYSIGSVLLFHYCKTGGYVHASLNTLFYALFMEPFHLKDSTGSLILYLLLTGGGLFFLLAKIENRIVRYIIAAIVIAISLPVLSMQGL